MLIHIEKWGENIIEQKLQYVAKPNRVVLSNGRILTCDQSVYMQLNRINREKVFDQNCR